MTTRSGPSATRIVLTLAGIAAGVTLALFAIGAAVGAVSGPPAVTAAAPVGAVATQTAAASVAASVAASTGATEARAATSRTEPEPTRKATAPAPKPKPAAKAKTKAEPKAKPAAKPAAKRAKHVAALPDRLKTLGRARQVVVVTSSAKSDRDGMLELYDLGTDGNWRRVMSATTRLGRNALVAGAARHQGSSTTPAGSWAMPTWGFGWAARPPKGSALGWKQIKSTSYWSAVPGSTYNTWVTSSSGVSGERLKSAGAAYEFAINSGYNAPPNSRVYGRGTAIFIHVMHPGYTAGCISIPRAKMIELLRKLEPARHPRCVIGSTDKGSSTSIWAY